MVRAGVTFPSFSSSTYSSISCKRPAADFGPHAACVYWNVDYRTLCVALFGSSHLLCSEAYLQSQTPTAAFEAYAAHPNHISLQGRAAICRGAQAHEAIDIEGWRLDAPLTLIVGQDDNLIRAGCKDAFLGVQDGVCCVELKGGHEVWQSVLLICGVH